MSEDGERLARMETHMEHMKECQAGMRADVKCFMDNTSAILRIHEKEHEKARTTMRVLKWVAAGIGGGITWVITILGGR